MSEDIAALIERLRDDHLDTIECEHGFLLHRDPCPNEICMARDLREAVTVLETLSARVEESEAIICELLNATRYDPRKRVETRARAFIANGVARG